MLRSYYYQARPYTPPGIGAPWFRLQTVGTEANAVSETNGRITSIEAGAAGQLVPIASAPVRETVPLLNNAQVLVCGPNSGLKTTEPVPAGLLEAHARAIYLLMRLNGVGNRRAFLGYGQTHPLAMVDLMTENGTRIGVHRYNTAIDAQTSFVPGNWQLVRLLLKDGTVALKVNQHGVSGSMYFASEASPLRLGAGGSDFWDTDGTVRLAHVEVYEQCPTPLEELAIEQRILGLYHLRYNGLGELVSDQSAAHRPWTPVMSRDFEYDAYSVEVPDFGQHLAGGPLTVEFWANVRGAHEQVAFYLPPNNLANRFLLHLPWSNGEVYFDYGDTVNGQGRNQRSFDALYYDSWHHYAFVSDPAAGTVTMYLDGNVYQSWPHTSDFIGPDATRQLLIGGDDTGQLATHGALGEFRIWGVAATPAQLTAYKDLTLEGPLPDAAGLLGCWRLDDDVFDGGVILDRSGHGRHGVLRQRPNSFVTDVDDAATARLRYNAAWATTSTPLSGYRHGTYRALVPGAGDGLIHFYYATTGTASEGIDVYYLASTAAWAYRLDDGPWEPMPAGDQREVPFSLRGLAAGTHLVTLRAAKVEADHWTRFDGLRLLARVATPAVAPGTPPPPERTMLLNDSTQGITNQSAVVTVPPTAQRLTVAFWLRLESTDFTGGNWRYLLDTRETMGAGYVANVLYGNSWLLWIDGNPINPDDVRTAVQPHTWHYVVLESSQPIPAEVRLVLNCRYTDDEYGQDMRYGPLRVFDRQLAPYERVGPELQSSLGLLADYNLATRYAAPGGTRWVDAGPQQRHGLVRNYVTNPLPLVWLDYQQGLSADASRWESRVGSAYAEQPTEALRGSVASDGLVFDHDGYLQLHGFDASAHASFTVLVLGDLAAGPAGLLFSNDQQQVGGIDSYVYAGGFETYVRTAAGQVLYNLSGQPFAGTTNEALGFSLEVGAPQPVTTRLGLATAGTHQAPGHTEPVTQSFSAAPVQLFGAPGADPQTARDGLRGTIRHVLIFPGVLSDEQWSSWRLTLQAVAGAYTPETQLYQSQAAQQGYEHVDADHVDTVIRGLQGLGLWTRVKAWKSYAHGNRFNVVLSREEFLDPVLGMYYQVGLTGNDPQGHPYRWWRHPYALYGRPGLILHGQGLTTANPVELGYRHAEVFVGGHVGYNTTAWYEFGENFNAETNGYCFFNDGGPLYHYGRVIQNYRALAVEGTTIGNYPTSQGRLRNLATADRNDQPATQGMRAVVNGRVSGPAFGHSYNVAGTTADVYGSRLVHTFNRGDNSWFPAWGVLQDHLTFDYLEENELLAVNQLFQQISGLAPWGLGELVKNPYFLFDYQTYSPAYAWYHYGSWAIQNDGSGARCAGDNTLLHTEVYYVAGGEYLLTVDVSEWTQGGLTITTGIPGFDAGIGTITAPGMYTATATSPATGSFWINILPSDNGTGLLRRVSVQRLS